MPRPRYQLVLFDLDGTLADSFPWFLRVANLVAREYDFREIGEADIDPLRRAGSREILAMLEVPLWKVPLIARRMRALKREAIADIALFPGAGEMLRALVAKGVCIGLVSSDSEVNARRQLGAENAALFSYFDCGAALFGKARRFARLSAKAGVTRREVIAIGDEVRDAEAAHAAGIAFGAVTWGYAHPDTLRALDPDAVFTRMEDIAEGLG